MRKPMTRVYTGGGKRMLKVCEAMAYTSMGKTNLVKWSNQIGAIKRIGRSVFFDRKIIDEAIDALTTAEGEHNDD